MSRLVSKYQNILTSITEITIGILLLIDPVGLTSGIIIAFGIIMVIMGAWSIVGYFRTNVEEAKGKNGLSKGLLLILVGLFCTFKSGWFIITFPIVTVLYGFVSLLSGLGKLQQAIDMLRSKRDYWLIALISAILTLLFAALILINPFASTAFLWSFIGISFLIEAVLDVITFIVLNKKMGNN